jgi:iron complex transport system ATP-binding protein
VVAAGAPRDVVDEALVQDVFDLRSVVVPDHVTGDPLVVPVGRSHHIPGAEPGAGI